jgi:hypothetical protein
VQKFISRLSTVRERIISTDQNTEQRFWNYQPAFRPLLRIFAFTGSRSHAPPWQHRAWKITDGWITGAV